MSTLKVDNIRHNNATSDAITMASDGTCTARITGMTGGSGLSHRNKFINGAMNISQRATSFTSTLTDGQYTLDRFAHIIRGTNDSHYTQVSDHPDNFRKSMKVKCNSTYTPSASDNAGFQSMLEGQDLQDLNFGSANANSFTVSFYAKSASQNNNHQYTFQIRTFPSGGATSRIMNFPFTVTSSWQRFTFTFTGDTGADIRNDNQLGMALLWNLNAGPDDIASQYTNWTTLGKFMCVTGQSNFLDNTSNEFYLTGVQLEVGDTATSFEHRNTSEELSRCQRYFYRIGGQSRAYQVVGNGFVGQNGGTKCAKIIVNFPTTMRDRPTLSVIGTDAFKGDTGGAASAMDCTATANTGGMWNDASSTDIAWVDFGRTGGGSPANGTAVVVYTTGAQGEVAFSAEL